MFYFTLHRNGITRAIYNGRVAFILNMSPATVNDFLEKKSKSDSVFDTIYHEFLHQNLFLLTQTGNYISGYRLLARLMWCVLRSEISVRSYYKARTFFYMETIELHEKLIESIENASEFERNYFIYSHELIKELRQADYNVKAKWKQNNVFVPPILKLYLEKLGGIYANHFAVVCGNVVGDQWKEEWVTDAGIVNDRRDRRKDEKIRITKLKKLSAVLEIEKWFPNSAEMDWKWMLVKFDEEYKNTVEKEYMTKSQFEEYVFEIMNFVAQWCNFKSYEYLYQILDSIEAFISKGNYIPVQPHWYKEPAFKKLINFFYLHGN